MIFNPSNKKDLIASLQNSSDFKVVGVFSGSKSDVMSFIRNINEQKMSVVVIKQK